MNVKGLLVLDAALAEFEQDMLASIAEELRRIGRKVQLTEFEYKPFYEEVRPYVEAIYVEGSFVMLDTSFHDTDAKNLYHFIEDLEINHRDLITLLHFLKVIPGKNKKLGSFASTVNRSTFSTVETILMPGFVSVAIMRKGRGFRLVTWTGMIWNLSRHQSGRSCIAVIPVAG